MTNTGDIAPLQDSSQSRLSILCRGHVTKQNPDRSPDL